MKTKLHYVLSITMFLFVFSVFSQSRVWQSLDSKFYLEELEAFNLNSEGVKLFKINTEELKSNITANSSKKNTFGKISSFIDLPKKDGSFETYEIFETSVFSPELAKKFPNIKSYVGRSTSNLSTRLRLTLSPNGMQTMISRVGGAYEFMQPLARGSSTYVLYHKNEHIESTNFKCETLTDLNQIKKGNASKINEGGANDGKLQTFRIAISVTGEYTNYYGGTVGGALAGINATLNRVNDIFEADMAITFQLVDATQLIFTDAATDPYSDAEDGTEGDWSSQLQNTLTSSIGESAYDIGHLFGASGGGGNADCIGCVCVDNAKGSGFSSPSNGIPEGDTFDLDFVIHEIGHQMGANHTWSFESEGTNVQSEPGSGSTIMAYAGITDTDNIQIGSDPYFHYHSIKQILDNVATKTCQTLTDIENQTPIANAGDDFTIPAGTAYVLKGSATDPDSQEHLSYCWEQIDSGIVNSVNFGSDLTSGSINRSLPPQSSPDRYVPNLKNVLNGQLTESNPGVGSSWESVSSTSRNLNWALTVRDNILTSNDKSEQTSFDTMTVTVNDNAGPFLVTSQSENGINLTPGASETITWDVANTNSGTINTSHVNILLSIDGGTTFSTVLLSNTPNDGSEDIIVPFTYAPFCRIKVEAVDNIYYAVNSTNFAINYTVEETCLPAYNSALNLNLGFDENHPVTHSINVPNGGIISDIQLSVDISHSYVKDVIIKLTHPNGTTSANVWNKNCFNESDIVMTFANFSPNINCNNTGESNTYNPSQLLDVFNGLEAAGTWTISVFDTAPQDNGTLNSWSLDICTQTAVVTNPDVDDNIDGIRVYPNPSEGDIIVAFNSVSNKNITILGCDMRGRVVLNTTYPSATVFREELHLRTFQPGMYIIEISDGDFKVKKKIIIK